MQKAAAKLVTEVPYEAAQTLFGDLTGVGLGSERMHTLSNHVAEGLTVLDVAPARDEIERRIAEVAAESWRRPVAVLGIDGGAQEALQQGHHNGSTCRVHKGVHDNVLQ